MFQSTLLIAAINFAVITFARPYSELNSGFLNRREELTIKADSPYDFSWISEYTALGDSYAAGLGSGHHIPPGNGIELNPDCNQWSYGYPNLLNAIEVMGFNAGRKFQYLACSGAKAPDVLEKQVPKMQTSQVVTLSAGGNDAGLAMIVSHCIYQPRHEVSCDSKLKVVEDDIDSGAFSDRLSALLNGIDAKLANANSRLYWVGYQKFWNAETDDCDKVTWSQFYDYGSREYLLKSRRQTMNRLVEKTNAKIKAVCGTNSRCVFVDTEDRIDELKGHFCEAGVDENGGKGANRERTLIRERYTTKDNDTEDEKNQPQKLKELNSRQLPDLSQIQGANDNSSFEGVLANEIALGIAEGALPVLDERGSPMSYAGMLTSFHPTKYGQERLGQNVVYAMVDQQAKIMNQPVEFDHWHEKHCPIKEAPYSPIGGPAGEKKDRCSIHVWENTLCAPADKDLVAQVQMWDAKGNEILAKTPTGDTTRHIDDSIKGGEWKSKLENSMVLTGEHNGDYIQFSLGGRSWTSKDTDKKLENWCSVGAWDIKKGGPCKPSETTRIYADRQMDCYFKCPWSGGPPSDGS